MECIDTQDIIDLRAHDIGCDTKGNHYLYFSQFCGDDVRIYKQTPLPTIEVKVPDLDQYKVQKKTVRFVIVIEFLILSRSVD